MNYNISTLIKLIYQYLNKGGEKKKDDTYIFVFQ